ncbi:MAG: glycoside hydrolase family 127 protein [Prolixibacteraceae bacterium]|nr:glycoside hydrolase family 127 protein [Prolixibacteraceae bacterium]MBN2775348.1 glycoside hydrolase family 127 protein [Prolixibacteraceae bacterium]
MKNLNLFWILVLFIVASCSSKNEHSSTQDAAYPYTGIPFSKVQIDDNFWLPRIETNRTATIPASFKKCEEMGRLDNFLIAGGKMDGGVKGEMPFDDTDVYKIIEGASYSMTTIPDPELDVYVDSLIEIIAIGQEEDGYLTTYKTIDTTKSPAWWCAGGSRWENIDCSHELYNSGHMFEAAAAHYLATGKRNFLDIALKNADLLVSVFGPDKKVEVPGHQIVETGLIKLYNITKKKDYLELAKFFLDARGDSTIRDIRGPYSQDHMPVTKQTEAVGHAVRAEYMYAGMTDIAALFNDEAYKNAVNNIWENVVTRKMYITGGVGALHDGEAFGENYELPNLTGYNETCAAIGNVYWNYRMFLLYGDAKYIDVLERSLYNGVISGVALDGKSFFYPNALECNMQFKFNRGSLIREPWFDCSCCPSNLCRFMPSIPGYIFAQTNDEIFVNLFVQSSTSIDLNGIPVQVSQKTNYPWDGDIKILVSPKKEENFTVKVRIPGWAQNQPLSGDLYSYANSVDCKPELSVNGEKIDYSIEKGFAILNRNWKKGDEINLSLPMNVRKVRANEAVEDDRGKVSLERGPVVYCLEEFDNPGIDNLTVSVQTKFETEFKSDLLDGIEIIKASDDSGNENFTAIPYYVWNNRGANKMKVWLPEN